MDLPKDPPPVRRGLSKSFSDDPLVADVAPAPSRGKMRRQCMFYFHISIPGRRMTDLGTNTFLFAQHRFLTAFCGNKQWQLAGSLTSSSGKTQSSHLRSLRTKSFSVRASCKEEALLPCKGTSAFTRSVKSNLSNIDF